MLKIKSNTNEFTIIFSEKIGKKKNAQKISFSLCSVQHPFFFSPSFLRVSASFPFFYFYFQRPSLFLFNASPFCFFSSCLSFLFSSRVALFSAQKHFFFSPKQFSVQPKNNSLFSPKPFSVQPKTFFSTQKQFSLQPKMFFSPRYFFSPKISPCLWFNASFFSFNMLPFSPSLVQPSIFKAIKKSSFGSVYPRPNILSSCFTFLLFE